MAAINKGWGKKLTGPLANYASASKGTLLLGDIQAHMIKEAAKPSTRRQDVVHPSEMAKTGWCPRSTYLRIAACREARDPFLKPAESVAPQLLNIFDEGHYIHDKWQKRLRDMGDLWGNWECAACGNVTVGHKYEANQFCEFCERHGNITIYREIPLKLPQYLISGSADGAVPRINALIEIKSVGVGTARIEAPEIYASNFESGKIDLQGLWRDIKDPFPAHIRQGQLYMAIAAHMGYEFDKIIFLYESKFNQGAKEFVVKYDPSVAYPLLQTAQSIAMALDGLAEIPQCPHNGCKDCEIYGSKSSNVRMGSRDEVSKNNDGGTGVLSIEETGGRRSGAAKRLIRPS